MTVTNVVEEIAAERGRQVADEGFDAAHDDRYVLGELPRAAACYALASYSFGVSGNYDAHKSVSDLWPWDWKWWKARDRRRSLIKAAALIVAEVERLDRKEGRA